MEGQICIPEGSFSTNEALNIVLSSPDSPIQAQEKSSLLFVSDKGEKNTPTSLEGLPMGQGSTGGVSFDWDTGKETFDSQLMVSGDKKDGGITVPPELPDQAVVIAVQLPGMMDNVAVPPAVTKGEDEAVKDKDMNCLLPTDGTDCIDSGELEVSHSSSAGRPITELPPTPILMNAKVAATPDVVREELLDSPKDFPPDGLSSEQSEDIVGVVLATGDSRNAVETDALVLGTKGINKTLFQSLPPTSISATRSASSDAMDTSRLEEITDVVADEDLVPKLSAIGQLEVLPPAVMSYARAVSGVSPSRDVVSRDFRGFVTSGLSLAEQTARSERLKAEAATLDKSIASTVWIKRLYNISNDLYLEATGRLVGDSNIVGINTDDRNRIEIVLKDQSHAALLIRKGIVANGQWLKAYKLAERPIKLIITKIPIYVPHATLAEALSPYGVCSPDDVDNIHAFSKKPTHKHIITYRRSVWLRVEEGSLKIPPCLVIYFAGRPHTVEITDGATKCFSCGKVGHIKARCPNISANYEPLVDRPPFTQGTQNNPIPVANTNPYSWRAPPNPVAQQDDDTQQWHRMGKNGKTVQVPDIHKITVNEQDQTKDQVQQIPKKDQVQQIPKKDTNTKATYRERNKTKTGGQDVMIAGISASNQLKVTAEAGNQGTRQPLVDPEKNKLVELKSPKELALSISPHKTDKKHCVSVAANQEGTLDGTPPKEKRNLFKKARPKNPVVLQKVLHIAKCYINARWTVTNKSEILNDPLEGMAIDEALLLYQQNKEVFDKEGSMKGISGFLDLLAADESMDSDGVIRAPLKRKAQSMSSSNATSGSPRSSLKTIKAPKGIRGRRITAKKKRHLILEKSNTKGSKGVCPLDSDEDVINVNEETSDASQEWKDVSSTEWLLSEAGSEVSHTRKVRYGQRADEEVEGKPGGVNIRRSLRSDFSRQTDTTEKSFRDVPLSKEAVRSRSPSRSEDPSVPAN